MGRDGSDDADEEEEEDEAVAAGAADDDDDEDDDEDDDSDDGNSEEGASEEDANSAPAEEDSLATATADAWGLGFARGWGSCPVAWPWRTMRASIHAVAMHSRRAAYWSNRRRSQACLSFSSPRANVTIVSRRDKLRHFSFAPSTTTARKIKTRRWEGQGANCDG